jgi:RNA polymerase sigma factor (sigma-70 family)
MTDWETILRLEGPAVWRTAWRILGNRADADDCLQDAFLSALDFSRQKPVQSWRALLTHLAAARAVDHLRKRSRRESHRENVELSELGQFDPLPPEQAEAAELTERLRLALADLPPQQAQVFCLARLEGWSYQEIAEQLSVSADVVGVWIHRAQTRLREKLASMNEVQDERA